MKTPKSLITAALLATLVAGCASDALVSPAETLEPLTEADAIGFGSMTRAKTRVTHEESAELLGKKFWVYGTKTKGTTTSPVFDNYLVEYSANTAGGSPTNKTASTSSLLPVWLPTRPSRAPAKACASTSPTLLP